MGFYWAIQRNRVSKSLNSIDENIKFTSATSANGPIPFLDVSISKSGGKIITDIYYKETDTRQYLPFHSSHPRHTKTNIPYCLALRIQTIVSDSQIREKRFVELQENLLRNGYPLKLIEQGILNAKRINRKDLLTKSTLSKKQTKATDTLIHTQIYNPNNPNIVHTLRQTINNLNASNMTCFQDKKLQVGYKQPPNLKKFINEGKL